jgi:hypothetical protein
MLARPPEGLLALWLCATNVPSLGTVTPDVAFACG